MNSLPAARIPFDLAPNDRENAAPFVQHLARSYMEAILDGDSIRASSLVKEALARGIPVKTIYLRVLMAAQAEVGDRWNTHEVDVSIEHRATQITLDQMAFLRQSAATRAPIGKRIVISSIEGDTHLIGARVIADFFSMDGWRVDFLGTDTPSNSLVQFVRDYSPDVVGISVSDPHCLLRLPALIREFRQLSAAPKILLGGSAMRGRKETFDADAVALEPHVAISQARKLVGLSGSNASLGQYLAELGIRIQESRKGLSLSQKELGKLAALDRAYISSLENGKQNVTVAALMKISDALQLPFEELLVGKG